MTEVSERNRTQEFRNLGLVPLLPLWAASAYVAWRVVSFCYAHGTIAQDAHAYWQTARSDQLYGVRPGAVDAFLYSPAFAQAVWPVAQLPWLAFATVWIALEVATFAWLLAPLGWRWAVPLLLLFSYETTLGNVYAWLALAAVVGISRPAAWSFPLLTKITPGMGVVWYAARGQTRQLTTVLGVTLLIALASFALSPQSWLAWIDFLFSTERAPLMPYRLSAGVILAVVGARTGRAWLLAPAMLLTSPVIAINSLTLLAAIPRLLGTSERV